jgi:hypothetical protein
MRPLLALLVLLGFATRAHADEWPAPWPAPAPEKDLRVAFAWSIATTGVGIGMIAAGDALYNRNDRTTGDLLIVGGGALALIGPSTGHWYAGKYLTPGLAVRGLAIGLGVAALVDCGDCAPEERTNIALVAGGAFAAGALIDLVLLPRTVARHNDRRVVVAPTVTGDRVGVAVVGTF